MLCNRIKQFREYHNIDKRLLADMLGIGVDLYTAYESGKATPDIDTITQLATFYKVTVKEFYGYTPPLRLHSDTPPIIDDDDKVAEALLKMSDLSWDEVQLILYYRKHGDDDSIIKEIIKERYPSPDKPKENENQDDQENNGK